MSKIFLQYNNNYYTDGMLSNITHIVYIIDLHENIKDLANIFKIKLKHRHIKTILQVNISSDSDIFKIVKFTCNNGFDGIIFSIENKESITKCLKIIKTLLSLPEPYNFNWEFYYMNLNNEILENLNYTFTGIINFDINNKNIHNEIQILNNENLQNLNNQDLFITNLDENIIKSLENIIKPKEKNTFSINNLKYPTSKFIKKITNNFE